MADTETTGKQGSKTKNPLYLSGKLTWRMPTAWLAALRMFRLHPPRDQGIDRQDASAAAEKHGRVNAKPP